MRDPETMTPIGIARCYINDVNPHRIASDEIMATMIDMGRRSYQLDPDHTLNIVLGRIGGSYCYNCYLDIKDAGSKSATCYKTDSEEELAGTIAGLCGPLLAKMAGVVKSAKENKGRIGKHNYYLEIAQSVAKRSTCLKRNYGAVIVKNDEIIATGYNGAPRCDDNCCDIYEQCPRLSVAHNSDYTGCRSVHAEQNAMISAARKDMMGSTMYLIGLEHDVAGKAHRLIPNAAPCPICARMIRNAGIDTIITADEDGTPVNSVIDIGGGSPCATATK